MFVPNNLYSLSFGENSIKSLRKRTDLPPLPKSNNKIQISKISENVDNSDTRAESMLSKKPNLSHSIKPTFKEENLSRETYLLVPFEKGLSNLGNTCFMY